MKLKEILLLIGVLLFVVYSLKGNSMSIFFKGEVQEIVLFSPLEGQLLFNGEPAVDAKIKLNISWEDRVGKDYIYTSDNQGFFSIPEHKTQYKARSLAQLVIKQTINVVYKNNEYKIWMFSKLSPEIYTELGGKAHNLKCEITGELSTVRGEGSLGGTNCLWSNINNLEQ